jgi:hypothetical protein
VKLKGCPEAPDKRRGCTPSASARGRNHKPFTVPSNDRSAAHQMQSPIEQVTMRPPHSQKNNHNQNARTPIESLVRIDPVRAKVQREE